MSKEGKRTQEVNRVYRQIGRMEETMGKIIVIASTKIPTMNIDGMLKETCVAIPVLELT